MLPGRTGAEQAYGAEDAGRGPQQGLRALKHHQLLPCSNGVPAATCGSPWPAGTSTAIAMSGYADSW